jgi:hypothetical protein
VREADVAEAAGLAERAPLPPEHKLEARKAVPKEVEVEAAIGAVEAAGLQAPQVHRRSLESSLRDRSTIRRSRSRCRPALRSLNPIGCVNLAKVTASYGLRDPLSICRLIRRC